MSFDRSGFKPGKEGQADLLTRAVSNFVPKASNNPLAREAERAEDEVAKESKGKERKLTREKVSSDSKQRRKERYGIKSSEEEESTKDDVRDEGDDPEAAEEELEQFEDDEFEDDESEDGESEDGEEEDFDLDLRNPTVRLLVDQNQHLMKLIELQKEKGTERQQEDATLALGSMSDLFTEEDITTAQNDPKAFLDLFTKALEHMGTRILQAVPEVVNKTYSRKSSMDRTVDDFFSENPQLQGRRDYVGFLAQKVAQERPNASAADVLVEAGKRAYKELGLKPSRKKKVTSGRKEKGLKKGSRRQNAAFARTPRGKSRTQPKNDARNQDQRLIDRIVASANVDNR